jgi:hypothetical protein
MPGFEQMVSALVQQQFYDIFVAFIYCQMQWTPAAPKD